MVINSIKRLVLLEGSIKIESPQKEEPNPIKRSFVKKPTKMLKKKKNKKS